MKVVSTTKNRLLRVAALLLCAALLFGMVPRSALAAASDPAAAAQAFVDSLMAGDYEKAEAMLAPEVAAQVAPLGGMEAFVAIMQEETGGWKNVGALSNAGEQSGLIAYTAVIDAQKGAFYLTLTVDTSGKIAGVAILPGPEDPIKMPKGYKETKVTITGAPGYPLEGRLVKPSSTARKVPLVVLVQGSGANGYDETIGVNRVFGKLAKGLAQQGIATLRYDKRTYAYPRSVSSATFSVRDEYVEDVLAAVEFAKAQKGIDPSRIYILGHSQGGMLAPMFIAEGADVAGMILLAGTPRNLMDVMDEQLTSLVEIYTLAGQIQQANELQAQLSGWRTQRRALEAMDESMVASAPPLYGMNAYYAYTLGQYDAIGTIKQLQKPTLILQGEKDMQVSAVRDFGLYKKELAGEKYVTTKLYKGLSHCFTPSTANNLLEAGTEYYAVQNIPSQVFKDIGKWVKAKK